MSRDNAGWNVLECSSAVARHNIRAYYVFKRSNEDGQQRTFGTCIADSSLPFDRNRGHGFSRCGASHFQNTTVRCGF